MGYPTLIQWVQRVITTISKAVCPITSYCHVSFPSYVVFIPTEFFLHHEGKSHSQAIFSTPQLTAHLTTHIQSNSIQHPKHKQTNLTPTQKTSSTLRITNSSSSKKPKKKPSSQASPSTKSSKPTTTPTHHFRHLNLTLTLTPIPTSTKQLATHNTHPTHMTSK